MFGIFKRRGRSQMNAPDSDWGIYLGIWEFQILDDWRINLRKKEHVPFKIRISPHEAERMLAQDERAELLLNYGRWIGDKFEPGQRWAMPGTDDIFFQSPDGLTGVRLKRPPLELPSMRRDNGEPPKPLPVWFQELLVKAQKRHEADLGNPPHQPS